MTAAARNNSSVFSFEVDRRSPIPVYIQISDAIRAKIQSGKLPPDSVLPPSGQICKELGITRMTLRQAYTVLAREGLVDAQRGRGTFVRRSRIERTLGQMVGFSEEMRARGKKPSSQTLLIEAADPSEPAREFLGEGPVYCIERLRLADAVPMAIDEVEIPVRALSGSRGVRSGEAIFIRGAGRGLSSAFGAVRADCFRIAAERAPAKAPGYRIERRVAERNSPEFREIGQAGFLWHYQVPRRSLHGIGSRRTRSG